MPKQISFYPDDESLQKEINNNVLSIYKRMIIQYVILSPAKIYKHYIHYVKDKTRRKQIVKWYYSDQAILECQNRITFAKTSPVLLDVCDLLHLSYKAVKEKIIEVNTKRRKRMISNNVANRPRLRKLKKKLQ